MSIRHGPPPRPTDLDLLNDPERWEALVRRIGERVAVDMEPAEGAGD